VEPEAGNVHIFDSVGGIERAQLAEVLLESLHDSSLSEIESEWEQEIEKRVAAFDRGELQTYPAEEVFAEARRMTQ